MKLLKSGLGAGIAAYGLWGLFPLFWPLLKPAGPVEILAHRIAWSFVFVAVLLLLTGDGLGWVRELGRRRLGLLTIAALLISGNWAMFIYGVNSGRVVETSLGYFVNPLVTVALAVLLLGETLRRAQWVAVAIAAFGVVVLAVDYGRPPYIALFLAFSFAAYGLTKKAAAISGTRSLMVETSVLIVPAVAVIGVVQATGHGTLTSHGPGHAALLATAGVATAVPLMLFGAAAIRIPLSTLGLLQYIAPVMQFLIGVLVDGEPLPPGRLAGFCFVWLALVLFSVDAWRAGRRPRRLAARPRRRLVVLARDGVA